MVDNKVSNRMMRVTPTTELKEVKDFFGDVIVWDINSVTGFYRLQEQLLLNDQTALFELYDGLLYVRPDKPPFK